MLNRQIALLFLLPVYAFMVLGCGKQADRKLAVLPVVIEANVPEIDSRSITKRLIKDLDKRTDFIVDQFPSIDSIGLTYQFLCKGLIGRNDTTYYSLIRLINNRTGRTVARVKHNFIGETKVAYSVIDQTSDELSRYIMNGDSTFAVTVLCLTRDVRVSASSTYSSDYTPQKAVDGINEDDPGHGATGFHSWATNRELDGAWIMVDWFVSKPLQSIVLCDRSNYVDQVLSATLAFSDGTVRTIGALPDDGTPITIDCEGITAQWVKFTVANARGKCAGLNEIEVYGYDK